MWKRFLVASAVTPEEAGYTSWQFGRTPEVGDELAELVLEGKKRATASLFHAYGHEGSALPKAGDLSVVTGGDGVARCIIRTTKVTVVPFDEVGAGFAWKEGEDDRSLEQWRDVHERCFRVDCEEMGIPFDRHMPVVCEEFEVVFP